MQLVIKCKRHPDGVLRGEPEAFRIDHCTHELDLSDMMCPQDAEDEALDVTIEVLDEPA